MVAHSSAMLGLAVLFAAATALPSAGRVAFLIEWPDAVKELLAARF